MAEEDKEQQLKDAIEKAKALETQLRESEEKRRDVTAESIKRKDQLNEFKEKEGQRKQQEDEAQQEAEKKRLAELPDGKREYEEMSALVKNLDRVIADQNAKIDELVSGVQASSQESIQRQKSAAVDEVLSTITFHDKADAKNYIEIDKIPIKNGEPDKDWIREQANEIATKRPYLLVPPTKPIPQWGGTAPPNPEPGPKPPLQEVTPEQKGVQLVERGLVDPPGALMDALSGTPGINDRSEALKKALDTPT